VFGFLRKVFNPTPVGFPARSTRVFGSDDIRPGEAEALRSLATSALHPPSSLDSDAGWDLFWRVRIEQPLIRRMEDAMDLAFCRDQRRALVATMRREGWQSVLCVGNGLSGEAAALADAGFAVTALDRSAFAIAHAPPVAPESPPFAAYFGQAFSRTGGSLRFVHGDLFDAQVCPGPFDVIIERRTLQLWSRFAPVADGDDCDRGLAAVTARLADAGLVVSHQHMGAWRPDQSRQHFAQQWLQDRGFLIASDWAPSEPGRPGRRAWLLVTSG
jgi:hypothetical protein